MVAFFWYLQVFSRIIVAWIYDLLTKFLTQYYKYECLVARYARDHVNYIIKLIRHTLCKIKWFS